MSMQPWCKAVRNAVEIEWEQKYIVIGEDFDSFTSSILLQILCPHALVIAIYETEYIVQVVEMTKDEFQKALASAIWVDQDVLNHFLCIGQHATTSECREPIPWKNKLSFNPNEFFRQRYSQSFRLNKNMRTNETAKCPISTAAMLLHVYNGYWKRNKIIDAVIRHSDSLASNALNYPINCESWRVLLFGQVNSQINCLMKETQSLYNVKNLKSTQCICANCDPTGANAKNREVMYQHAKVMTNLVKLAPHCCDINSRNNEKESEEFVQRRHEKIQELVSNKRPREEEEDCCEQIILGSCVQTLCGGGYQGLKLASKPWLKKDANMQQYLNELNSVYSYVAAEGFQLTNIQKFVNGTKYKISQPYCSVIFEKINPKTNQLDAYVNLKTKKDQKEPSHESLPLMDFIREKRIFSYAILGSSLIRWTCYEDNKILLVNLQEVL